ncbi:hypothetical protein K491DRAFT_611511 [Lophiostoma macrostomum CBS 122681]|uniref:FAD-binding FR-type domain-containing protein n=1 Tax=Lophiostoma macrostomum CBS 122681 TaxID=1314788 RepID=A0A6A6SNA0_9PLEO|nr:hypothetical protein K491DRAFT_611511 [Lophiostoma macrostomum CBS 122681]
MVFSLAMSWNAGESKMHNLMHVPNQDNPTSSMLTPQASFNLQRNPLLALGTLDADGRPWTTLWGGQPGFSEPLGGGMIGTRTIVDWVNDPVVEALLGRGDVGKEEQMIQPEGGKMVAGLSIDLMTRKRVKIAGRMIAGTFTSVDTARPSKQHQIQLVTQITQSLGNCPKYLNQYTLRPALISSSQLISSGPELPDRAKDLISKADMFFVSSTTATDMDTNHRGGPPGFARILSASSLVYPEYSGNRLYQTLGNLQLNPRISLTFPDYESGDVLYVTGTAKVLVLDDAANVLPGSNLAVKVEISEARYVQGGLPFRGERKVPSPYNPRVRTLVGESGGKASATATSLSAQRSTARLTKKSQLTPTIARFTFSVQDPAGIDYEPGQWIALDFKEHMDIGYSHMRDDDPRSLNDDFVRTFTISSTPTLAAVSKEKEGKGQGESEFEITIRNVGAVTGFLFRQNARAGFEVPVLGVGGDFWIPESEVIPFIAAGVGITPLLGHLPLLHTHTHIHPHSTTLRLFWTLRAADVGLVRDSLDRYPQLAGCVDVFFTSADQSESMEVEIKEQVQALREKGVRVHERRLVKGDLEGVEAQTWYLCAGKGFRKEVLGWLEGRRVVFEDFDY